uniref:Uncharacterized protein n=1 Tax=Panagrolaimus sp. ES5 TaxID=591445 RepID=A0AC34F4J2_9BILA
MSKLFYIFSIIILFVALVNMTQIDDESVPQNRFKRSNTDCRVKCCGKRSKNCGECKFSLGFPSRTCGLGKVCVCKK